MPGAGRRGAAAVSVEGGDAAVGATIQSTEVGTEPYEVPEPDWCLSPTNGSGSAAMGVEGGDAAVNELVSLRADELSILEFNASVPSEFADVPFENLADDKLDQEGVEKGMLANNGTCTSLVGSIVVFGEVVLVCGREFAKSYFGTTHQGT